MKALVLVRGRTHQPQWGGAFAEGLRRHGWETEVSAFWKPSDMLVTWGVRRVREIARQKRHGEVCILERGYVGDRFAWTSVSFGGGLNGRAAFRTRNDPERFERHHGHMLKPWRRKEGYALLVGQVRGDMSLAPIGGSLNVWYRETAAQLEDRGWRVRFRHHPLAKDRPQVPAETLGGPLGAALDGAGLVATWNSNTAVEAALAGVPTIAMDRGSMAWDVSGHTLDEVVTPDRSEWAARLAWTQWREDEMRSGECWDAVGPAADDPAASGGDRLAG